MVEPLGIHVTAPAGAFRSLASAETILDERRTGLGVRSGDPGDAEKDASAGPTTLMNQALSGVLAGIRHLAVF